MAPARRFDALTPVLPIGILCALAVLIITRPGYSPDEEITAVLTTAIGSKGAPILPSGILYHRGVPYLYLSWLSGALFGQSMIAWRFASLVCGAAGLVFAFRLGFKLGGAACGRVLATLLAVFPPFVAASGFARQYSALVASALLFLWLFAQWTDERRRAWSMLLAVAGASLLHPTGIALAGLPIIFAALDDRTQRTSALSLAFGACAIVVSVSCLSFGAHLASLLRAGVTVSRDTAIYAIPSPSLPAAYVVSLAGGKSWIAAVVVFSLLGYALDRFHLCSRTLIVISAACGLGFQLGLMLLVVAIAIVVRPDGTRRLVLCVAALATASIVWWSIHTAATTDARLSLPLAASLARAAASYPLGSLWFALSAFPAMSTFALLGCTAALSRPTTDSSRTIRAVTVLALIFLAALDVASIPVAERYLLLPWTLLAIVAAAGFTAVLGLVNQRGLVTRTLIAGASAAWLVGGFYRYGQDRETLAPVGFTQQLFAPATGPSWTPELLSALVVPGDTAVCTEELACTYLVGRVDYLFALPPTDVAHYVVSRTGTSVGFYAGAPVLSSQALLEKMLRETGRSGCAAMVSLRTGKVDFAAYNRLIAETGSRFDSRVVFSNEETRVTRICSGTIDQR